jgi:hypothetical protein
MSHVLCLTYVSGILTALAAGKLDVVVNDKKYPVCAGYATDHYLAIVAEHPPGGVEGGLVTIRMTVSNGGVGAVMLVDDGCDGPSYDRVEVEFLEAPKSRIPQYTSNSHLISWVLGMRRHGLLFHPDDDICNLRNGEGRPLLTGREALILSRQIPLLKKHWGDDLYSLLHVLSGGPDGPEDNSE